MIPNDPIERAVRAHFTARVQGCDRLPEVLAFLHAEPGAPPPAHLVECEDCRALVADWPATTPLFETSDNLPLADLTRPSPPRWLVRVVLVAACLVAAALWLAPDGRIRPQLAPPEPIVRAKGAWSLQVGVRRGDETFRVQPGQRLDPGDRLGLFYSADTPGHLRIVYVEASGAWVQLYPPAGGPDAVEAGEEVRLDAGAVLTEGAGCDAIVGVFAAENIDDDALRETLDGLGRGADGCLRAHDLTTRVIEVQR